jgi:hypothetical protein
MGVDQTSAKSSAFVVFARLFERLRDKHDPLFEQLAIAIAHTRMMECACKSPRFFQERCALIVNARFV